MAGFTTDIPGTDKSIGPNGDIHQSVTSLMQGEPNGWDAFINGIQNWWSQSALNPGNFLKKIGDGLGISNLNNATQQGKIAYTSSGVPYDETNTDSQINALLTEYANKRDDYAYDRLIAALKRNGINPAIALSNSASPMSSESGFRSSYNLTDKDQINSALKAGSIIALIMSLFMHKGG